MTLTGRWAKSLWVTCGDKVTIIGNFNQQNSFHLKLCDEQDQLDLTGFAQFLIVEPQILIPTTQIVKATPCMRRAYITNLYRNPEINYAQVLGNIVHEVFQ